MSLMSLVIASNFQRLTAFHGVFHDLSTIYVLKISKFQIHIPKNLVNTT